MTEIRNAPLAAQYQALLIKQLEESPEKSVETAAADALESLKSLSGALTQKDLFEITSGRTRAAFLDSFKNADRQALLDGADVDSIARELGITGGDLKNRLFGSFEDALAKADDWTEGLGLESVQIEAAFAKARKDSWAVRVGKESFEAAFDGIGRDAQATRDVGHSSVLGAILATFIFEGVDGVRALCRLAGASVANIPRLLDTTFRGGYATKKISKSELETLLGQIKEALQDASPKQKALIAVAVKVAAAESVDKLTDSAAALLEKADYLDHMVDGVPRADMENAVAVNLSLGMLRRCKGDPRGVMAVHKEIEELTPEQRAMLEEIVRQGLLGETADSKKTFGIAQRQAQNVYDVLFANAPEVRVKAAANLVRTQGFVTGQQAWAIDAQNLLALAGDNPELKQVMKTELFGRGGFLKGPTGFNEAGLELLRETLNPAVA